MSKYEELSKGDLSKLLKKRDLELKNKKYGLVWDDEKEPEKVVLDCKDYLPILQRIKGKVLREPRGNIEGDNILIEGDNYHALTVLNYTHQEKIDLIYIDPPYNTGEDDFKYNDNYVDKEDGYKHSKWLNFMQKRLTLAKNLLTNKGIIFISIDDNEKANLKLLCNMIFGEANFIAECIRKTKSVTSDAKTGLNIQHEYILIFAKNSNLIQLQGKEKSYSGYSNPDNDPLGLWTSSDPTAIDDGRKTKNTDGIENPYTGRIDKPGSGRRWRFNKKGFDKLVQEGRVIFKKNYGKNERGFILKRYKNELHESFLPFDTLFGVENKYLNQVGTKELKLIFGEAVFDFPKPVSFITDLIKSYKQKDITVLDFFAGSGTTGHAVLQLNKEDSGKRKFILCTNNENNICAEITYPRVEKVIKGYDFKGKDKTILFEKKLRWTDLSKNSEEILKEINEIIEQNKLFYDEIKKEFKNSVLKIVGIKNIDGVKEGLGGNLQYFETSLLEKTKNRDQTKINLTQKCAEMLCLKENIFNAKIEEEDYKIFSSNDKKQFLCVYFNFIDKSFNDFLKNIKLLNGKKIIYMFSLEDEIDLALFEGIGDFVLIPIPQRILDIYKKLVKMNIPIKAKTIFVDLAKAKKQVFEDKDKDTGAKTLRVVLEKVIQKIAQKRQVNILTDKGKEIKVAVLNDILKKENIFKKLDWEENKTYLTLGNHASHGEYDEFDQFQVNKFYKHVQKLIEKFRI